MTIKRSRNRQPERIEFARGQRQSVNEFATDVWQMVRARQILNAKFRREYPLGPYTLDFACVELMLDIEIDGKDHQSDDGKQRDASRDQYLHQHRWTVLRISGFRVTQDPQAVRKEIERIVRELMDAEKRKLPSSPSPPAPLPEAGRGEPELVHVTCVNISSPKRGSRSGDLS